LTESLDSTLTATALTGATAVFNAFGAAATGTIFFDAF
tara:strand:+ start:113 stop:226 length:114 start_codon:yes stop_codon:yes gene_type:complete